MGVRSGIDMLGGQVVPLGEWEDYDTANLWVKHARILARLSGLPATLIERTSKTRDAKLKKVTNYLAAGNLPGVVLVSTDRDGKEERSYRVSEKTTERDITEILAPGTPVVEITIDATVVPSTLTITGRNSLDGTMPGTVLAAIDVTSE